MSAEMEGDGEVVDRVDNERAEDEGKLDGEGREVEVELESGRSKTMRST